MVLKAKKAQSSSMRKALLEIIVFSMFFLLLVFVLASLWDNLKGTSLEEQAEMQFTIFTSNIQLMTYTKSNYTMSYSQVLMPSGYYLVAFSGASTEIQYNDPDNGKPKTVFRPEKVCNLEPDYSCLCLYKQQPENHVDKKHKHIVACRQISTKMIVANHIYNSALIYPGSINNKAFLFSESPSFSFLGGTFSSKSSLGSHIRGLIEANSASNIKEQTQYLGFFDESIKDVPLHDFVLKSKQPVPIPLYLEVIKSEQNSLITIFPYSYGLSNRKYFVTKYPGQDICDDQFMNSIFEVSNEPGNMSYCESSNSGLIISDNRIDFCNSGPLTEICACGGGINKHFSRAITSGYCAKFDIDQTTVVNFPDDYCKEIDSTIDNDCLVYHDKYSCAANPCKEELDLSCFWDDTILNGGACVSACATFTSCADYDVADCNKDPCGVSGLGCVWGIENNQETCMDLCDEITACIDYEGKFECKDDLCNLYPPGNPDLKKCEYNDQTDQCSTETVEYCETITECFDYLGQSNCEQDPCDLYPEILEGCVWETLINYDTQVSFCNFLSENDDLTQN